MSTGSLNDPGMGSLSTDSRDRPPTTDETKPSFKTTELLAYLGTVVAIIVTCIAVDGDDGGADPFNANDAMKYITWATIGYVVARGLAKSGRRWYGDDGNRR